jgi:hypothetical protein
MPLTVPSPVGAAAILVREEVNAGVFEADISSLYDAFPHTIVDARFPYQEREVHEARGPMSRNLQGQELLSIRYPFSVNFELYDPTFVDKMIFDDAIGDMRSTSWAFNQGPTAANPLLATAIWGAKCDRWTLSAAEHEVIRINSDWIGMHADTINPFTWTPPTGRRPFTWAGGTFDVNGTSGDLIGIDMEVRNNLSEHYPMEGTISDYPFDPKYLISQAIEYNLDLRMLTDFELDWPFVNSAEVILAFQSPVIGPTSTIQFTLSGGTFRNQEVDFPSRNLVGYRVPMVFESIAWQYTY